MNTFWIHDGKKFTIIGTLAIALSVIGILGTENTLQAAFFGIMIPIFGVITIKSAMGWSWARSGEKQRKKRNFQFQ